MRLLLALPSEVALARRGDHHEARVGDLVLRWGPLFDLPDDQQRWYEDTLRLDLAPDARIDVVADVVDRTQTGWPIRIITTSTTGRWRAHAFFAFLEHAGVVVVDAVDRDSLAAALPILRSASPRWDGVVALADLWDVPIGASPTE
jgi:hypothetical protein